jgi:iron complex outermembrane receptor protein
MRKQMLLTLLGVSALTAVGQVTTPDTIRLNTVEIVESVKAPVALLPLEVTTITSSELEHSTESSVLPVLVNRVPGLFVTERSMSGFGVSTGAAGTVSIRGIGDGNKVLFMIDGQPQWAGIFGHSLADTYTSSQVERVEVVRGPSSLLYGSNAMGGSVNIITKRATRDGLNGSARAMWGTHDTQKYSLNLGYKHKGWNSFISATYESSNGQRQNMSYWLASQFASLEYTFSHHWKAGANVNLTESRPHNPGSLQSPLEDMWTQVLRGTASVFIKNSYSSTSGGIQAYTNWGRHKIDDGHTPGTEPTNYLFRSNDYNMGITAYQTVKPWQDDNLSLGVDFKHWGGHSWNVMKDGSDDVPGIDKQVNEIAGYAMMQQALFDKLLSLNAGLRIEHSSQFGNQLVPQAGFILRPIKDNTIKFSWGKGFRSPNIRELYMYRPANPDLKPEHLYNYEVEVRQSLLDKRLDFGVSLFFIDAKDMIQTTTVDGRPLNINTGAFRNKGFELEVAYQINRQWTIDGNYSYLHTSKPLLAAPRNKLFGEINYRPGNWDFTLESLSIWGLYTQTSPTKVENYSLLNIRIGYTFQPSQPRYPITIFCKGDNLTNKKYEINYGFPMPGTTIMAGLDLKF